MAAIEIEFIRTYMSIQQRTAELKFKLSAMRDMRGGCKLGVSDATGALYVDKPSIFQGAARWLYGQNRYVVSDYLHREIMEKGGLIDLVVNLRDRCAELFMHCSDAAIRTVTGNTGNTGNTIISNMGNTGVHRYASPGPSANANTNINTNSSSNSSYSSISISENTRKVFKMLCAHNIELLMVVGHGLGVLSVIYQPNEHDSVSRIMPSITGVYNSVLTQFQSPPSQTPNPRQSPIPGPMPEAVIGLIHEMQRRVKMERVILERVLNQFNMILKHNPM
jgi:hypothetical protein